MLPNLSALHALTLWTNTKRLADEAGLGERPQSEEGRVLLQDVDWAKMFKESDKKRSFVVYVPRTGDRTWKMEFHLKDGTLKIVAGFEGLPHEERCVSVDDYGDYLYVGSLFHALSDEALGLCNVQPAAGTEAGYGAATLEVIDVIAAAKSDDGKEHESFELELQDSSTFRSDEDRPKVSVGWDISQTLWLLRGFSYYEARGFVCSRMWEGVKNRNLLAAAMQADLDWTHMIFTTPINKLADAIRGFSTQVLARGDAVPDFTRNLYSADFCAAHAVRAQNTFVAVFVKRFADAIPEDCVERLGVKSYADLSVRALAQAKADDLLPWDQTDFEYVALKLFNDVWSRPRGTGRVNASGDEYILYYPDSSMNKPFFRGEGPTASYNAVVPNPVLPKSAAPIVKLMPVRTDITVEFLNGFEPPTKR